jgi:toxin ParE1/3/4
MSHYRLSRQADRDLDAIADYIADFNPAAAYDVLDKLHDTFAFLASNPEVGTLREDLRPSLRVFTPERPAHNYVVFFQPRADGMEVITVIHGARDWESMFDRGER